MRPSLPSRLWRDRRGATIVEFAIVCPVLCLTLLGFMELGYKSYVGSIVQGALHEAARSATVGDKTGAQIDALVQDRLKSFSSGATITINKSSYTNFSDVKMPEKITQDTAPLGSYNTGDCYEDANGNGAYDIDRGKSGLGGSDDIVNYEIVMTFPPIVPLWRMIGGPSTETIRASTVLRNQPYASRTTSVTVRCT
ncbi:MAG TPA: TadE/TadG family type IV pilus assembly protein [Allosphingosinicella sp.]|jgi:Flp pilus assembly pilin Flp